MKNTDFEESNFTFMPPEGDDGRVLPLKCFYNGELIISAWDMASNDILNLLMFRRVWLRIESGNMPPVLLETTSPFVGSENVITETDKEKARSVKERLAKAFLGQQNYGESIETDLSVKLIKFIDFLCERGED